MFVYRLDLLNDILYHLLLIIIIYSWKLETVLSKF